MIPKASFVIPVYNGEEFLSPAIKSCLGQSVKNVEVIVINDGSTDTTQKVIDFWTGKDERVKNIKFDVNKGRSIARNAGIEAAKSDFIFAMDADDLCLANRVSETIGCFKKNPTADIVYGGFHLIDVFGNPLGHVPVKPFSWNDLIKTKFTYIGHSTMAFKKSLGVYYTDGEYSKNAIDDWKFQVDAAKKGAKFVCVDKILSVYRVIQKQRDEKRILELKEATLAEA